ncbi:MAG: hypothetical protein ACRDQ5_23220 [Sciscionella sp.]
MERVPPMSAPEVTMSQALNTTVNGSSGTCVEAADWLSGLYAEAHDADGATRDARGAAESGWHGPAEAAFADALHGIPGDMASLTENAYQCEWALRDFAAALDKVVDTMNAALERARSGDLRVDGPFIIAPQAPPPITSLPTGRCTPQDAQVAARNYQGDIAALREAQIEYNTKAAVYNACKALVEDARRIEQRAHEELRASMHSTSDAAADWVSIGLAATSRALSYITTLENPRREAANTATRLTHQARFLQDYALGRVADATPLQKRILELSASKARDAAAAHARAKEFEKFLTTVPQGARDTITAYPGKAALDDPAAHTKTPLPEGAIKTLKGMPYLGGVLVAGTEIWHAMKGQQSWTKAGADTTGIVVGSAIGGAEAGFYAGMISGAPAGPVGSLVVGTVGATIGAIAGQQIVDHFVPK